MKFLNIIYYHYYLFYNKILKDMQPIFTTTFTFSFSLSLVINGCINIVLAHTNGTYLNKWSMISIFVIIFIFNYLYYYKRNKANELILLKPKLDNSNYLSAFITILFFLICVSFLFWEPIYTRGVIHRNFS